jgi:aquaporin Z
MRAHWPEYAIEALLLGLFMVSAGVASTLVEAPASPLRAAIADPFLRRALVGVAMGATAIALVYSPFGRRSGAHMNPALTLSYLRLGKIRARDAAGYALAQIAGGAAGVLLVSLALGDAFRSEPVLWIATRPGVAGAGVAFAAEAAISFVLMATVLVATSVPRLAPFTGVLCGALVATYITFESPLSGMSMNPARTLASALPSAMFEHVWIYLAAPPLGMLLAVQVVSALRSPAWVRCAKLDHAADQRCIFCGYEPREVRNS